MKRRGRIGRLIGGVALIGGFLTWLVMRAEFMELIGQTGNMSVGLALHSVAWLTLIGGVSLLATEVSTSSARSSSPAQPSPHEQETGLERTIGSRRRQSTSPRRSANPALADIPDVGDELGDQRLDLGLDLVANRTHLLDPWPAGSSRTQSR